jgi:hypothetical protein
MSNGITQGVWRKGERVSYGGSSHGFPIYFNDDGEQVVDYVYSEADADLICAAPQLLLALESCKALLESAGLDSSDEYQASITVIAKARGA